MNEPARTLINCSIDNKKLRTKKRSKKLYKTPRKTSARCCVKITLPNIFVLLKRKITKVIQWEVEFNLRVERKILITLFVAIKLNLIEVPRSLMPKMLKCERYRGTEMLAILPFSSGSLYSPSLRCMVYCNLI